MKLESEYQRKLIKKLNERFPGCIVTANDGNYIQGFPDITIYYKNKWATLECKISENASHQPNQDFWVDRMNQMSFSSFIYPENEEEVFDALDQSFKS